MLLAIQELPSDYRSVLDNLWSLAREGHEDRLAERCADPSLGESSTNIDLGAWPAIAGDHSCSPQGMLNTILESDWILDVADVSVRLGRNLKEAESRAARDNAMRNADIELQRADPEYATRAAGNAVHYPAPRSSVGENLDDYFKRCIREGSEINAVGAYTWYHTSALLKAARLARGEVSSEDRPALARSILADESFALHFLEDLFAAGHSAATWGNSAVRKGTHDYYNEFGFETRLWSGEPVVLLGDAYMRPQDAELAAKAVRASLQQVLDASEGKDGFPQGPGSGLSGADTLNACQWWTMPRLTVPESVAARSVAVIAMTPIPGLSEGYGELPRFRAELGGFIGVSAATQGNSISGTFAADQNERGAIGSLEFSLVLGYGLEGIMNRSSDGLAFLELGFTRETPSSTGVIGGETVKQYGAIFAGIPARSATVVRARLPFWLLPGDLLLAAPILLIVSPETLARMGVDAVNGGLIPWQAKNFTTIGTFQFVAGREIAAAFYGYGVNNDRFLIPDVEHTVFFLTDIRSIKMTFPILEYRPFRSFSTDQSSSLVFQMQTGFDRITRKTIIDDGGAPPGAQPKLRSYWFVGLRISFDWRHYF